MEKVRLEKVVLIWSFEHNAWWRPGSHGFTTNIEEAGFYSRITAEEIVLDANTACEPDNLNEEIRNVWVG